MKDIKTTDLDWIIQETKSTLQKLGSDKNLQGMQRFGIQTTTAFGTGMSPVRDLAKTLKRSQASHRHELALGLWKENIHELRILAAWIDDPKAVTEAQMEAWVKDFNSWDLCDQVCMRLFCRSPLAEGKIQEWAFRGAEFEKRAAFALIAAMAVHRKKEPDALFLSFLPLIKQAAEDNRNFVWKAVNWALRQIGKRNSILLEPAWILALELAQSPHKAARKVGKDAVREFEKKFGN